MEQHTLLQREESPRSPAAPSLRRLGGSRHITHWDPEDLGAWEAGNKGIARRNLLWSVVTVHLGYFGVDALAGAGVADAPGRLRLFNQ